MFAHYVRIIIVFAIGEINILLPFFYSRCSFAVLSATNDRLSCRQLLLCKTEEKTGGQTDGVICCALGFHSNCHFGIMQN